MNVSVDMERGFGVGMCFIGGIQDFQEDGLALEVKQRII